MNSTTPVIDVWVQHPTPRMLAEPMFDSLRRWTGQALDVLPDAATEQALRGVDKALLSAWYGPQGALISNDEVLRWVQRDPQRYFGLAGVDLRNPVAAQRELRRCVREHGFKGLRIVQWLWELPCSHPLYYPLLAECVALNVPVCLQVGLTGPLHSSESGRPLHIERVALDFPDLTIVCGHIGYPWQLEMIALATKFPNVYIDTSAYKPRRYPGELVAYMRAHGRDKVMFGSNWPMIAPQDCLAQIDELGLDADTQAAFLSTNAIRVFGL